MVELNEANTIKAVRAGIYEAAEDYIRWTNGYEVPDYGTEHVINVYIARHLSSSGFGSEFFIVLEDTIKNMSKFSTPFKSLSKLGHKFELDDPIRHTGRVDVSLYLGDELFSVIETKHSINHHNCDRDFLRIKRFLEISNRSNGGIMDFALFCSLEYLGDGEDFESLKNKLKKRSAHVCARVGGISRKIFMEQDLIIKTRRGRIPVPVAQIVKLA